MVELKIWLVLLTGFLFWELLHFSFWDQNFWQGVAPNWYLCEFWKLELQSTHLCFKHVNLWTVSCISPGTSLEKWLFRYFIRLLDLCYYVGWVLFISRYLDLSQKAQVLSHLDIKATVYTNVLVFCGLTPDSVDHFFCYLQILLLFFFIFKIMFFIACMCMYHGVPCGG